MEIRIWDTSSLDQLRVVEHAHKRSILCMHFSVDVLATGGADATVRVFDLESTYKVPFKYVKIHRRLRGGRYGGHQDSVTAVHFAGTELVSGDATGLLLIWDVHSGLVLRRCQTHTKWVRQITFDATKIVSCSDDCTVCVTDISLAEVIDRLKTHSKPVLACSFDTTEIISAGADNIIGHAYFRRTTHERQEISPHAARRPWNAQTPLWFNNCGHEAMEQH